MSSDAWITLAIVVVTVGALATERVRPSLAVLAASCTLLILDVIDSDQAFAGFSNPAPISVAALYVMAGAVEVTGAFSWVTERMTGGARRTDDGRGVLARMMPITLGSSAFLNNTTIVAMLAPPLDSWARRTGVAASRVLMPLSFAAILGGVVTAIGTSTNLVVSGLLEQSGSDPIGLFEITAVGLPLAVIGGIFLALFSARLLPERQRPDRLGRLGREFTVEMGVAPTGQLVGRAVGEAGLRNLTGVYLVEIERAGQQLAVVHGERGL